MMNRLKKENERISSILAFALIPVSGLAVDIYVPSIPSMAADLHTTPAVVKLTMTVFLISYGIAQLFVGRISDSYGRYKLNIFSLLLFTASCIGIAVTKNIHFILLLRFIQGIVVAVTVVTKRAFFIDVYEGEKRKHYTSLLTVVWAVAPIVAPFLGGYLQTGFGWKSNFYFLALYGFVMLLLELKFSGETIKTPHVFHWRAILNTYRMFFSAKDFFLGVLTLGLSYAMAIVFGMSIPFIVEHHFHLSPVITGYCALCSGIAIFAGGLWSKYLIHKPLFKKLRIVNVSQLCIAVAMFGSGGFFDNIYAAMLFVALLHLLQGFMYNSYFTYCVTRFPEYAASAAGITSGGGYIFLSVFSYAITASINMHDQRTLSISYIILSIAIFVVLLIV
jgi:MFS family permease